MFASKSIVRLVPQARLQMAVHHREMSVISGPPRVRISTAEKIGHAVAIIVGMVAIPAWVLTNIKNYKRHE